MGSVIPPVTGARVLWALRAADVIIEGGQSSLNLPQPGSFLSLLDIAGRVRGLLEHSNLLLWQLYLQPRLVMEKSSSTLQWPRREWEGLK